MRRLVFVYALPFGSLFAVWKLAELAEKNVPWLRDLPPVPHGGWYLILAVILFFVWFLTAAITVKNDD